MRDLVTAIGHQPYRLALAGGWIDQPFMSRVHPGSMVVVSIEPDFRLMERCGFATGTRKVAARLWGDEWPRDDLEAKMRELYAAENEGLSDPSGSQDMAGLLFPGISRLDYDVAYEGGIFPRITSCLHEGTLRWLEQVIHLIPVEPRPPGYNPLGRSNLNPKWVNRLGYSGSECFEAIRANDLERLGLSMNLCTSCWGVLLPDVLEHPLLKLDLVALVRAYQESYPGAMYSGCGGGYLIVASETPPPGSFQVRVRR